MMTSLELILVVAATALTGLLAGINLDKALVQLPARHRLGVVPFAAFSRANDLGRGLFLYPSLGLASALLTIAATLVYLAKVPPMYVKLPLYTAVGLAVLHTVATARAAPLMLSLRNLSLTEAQLTSMLNGFARWHGVRTLLQVLHFAALLWALHFAMLWFLVTRTVTLQ